MHYVMRYIAALLKRQNRVMNLCCVFRVRLLLPQLHYCLHLVRLVFFLTKITVSSCMSVI